MLGTAEADIPDLVVAEFEAPAYQDADMFEILARESTAPPFTVEGVICDRGTMFTGLEGVGKSTVLAHLTYALAAGLPDWCGRRITADRELVVEVACTDIDGPAEYADRWKAFGGSANLRAMTLPDRQDGQDWEALTRFLVNRHVDVFVLDNLMESLPEEGDINQARDATPIIRGLKMIRNEGIIPILVHHTSDTGDDPKARRKLVRRPMGSKKYSQWARHTVTLASTTEYQRVLTVQKANYWKTGDQTFLSFAPDQPELGYDMIQLDDGGREEYESRKRSRSAATLDRNGAIAHWIVENCQGKIQKEVGELVAAQYGENASTVVTALSGGRKYGALVTYEKTSKAWTLKS